jgi:hypothetical protein
MIAGLAKPVSWYLVYSEAAANPDKNYCIAR